MFSTVGSGPAVMPAAATTALASGCSDRLSSAAARRSTVARSCPGTTRMSVTRGVPSVSVPVLSKTMVSTAASRSSGSPPLIRMPAAAPRPLATITAVGTARPMAQGQAMINTATAAVSADANDGVSGSSIHAAKVAIAIEITTGTKTAEMRSARRWIGACEPCASFISVTMRARTLAAPIAVARTSRAAVWLTVAPITRSPGAFSTGMDSPVSIDSSTAPLPLVTSPSTGKRSPGRTSTTSPARTAAIGMSCSCPSRRTRAVEGCSFASCRNARVVCVLARASMALPSSTRAMMMMTAS